MPIELLCTADDVSASWPQFAGLAADAQAVLINDASQAVLDYVHRPGFLEAVETETFSGSAGVAIYLARRPVLSILSVTANGEALDNTANDAWTFAAKSGELIRGDGRRDPSFARWWPTGTANVVVQYWGGAPEVPGPVRRATIQLVQWLAARAKTPGLYQSERIGDYSYSLNAAAINATIPAHVAALLWPYVADGVFA